MKYKYRYRYDNKYLRIVKDILSNSEFAKMENIVHHKANRMLHLLRVSYYSYLVSKFLRLDYISTARGALLHDFFYEDNNKLKFKKKVESILKHPKRALENSKKQFELNNLEQDIIVSHMFPIGLRLPRYFESWIVDIVDDIASIFEVINNGYKRIKLRVSN